MHHDGSSNSTEAALALKLTVELHNKTKGRIYTDFFVSDDEFTMRSFIKHEINYDKGKLPINDP